MNHVAHMNESWHIHAQIITNTRTTCRSTRAGATAIRWLQGHPLAPIFNKSCHTYNHATHMNESHTRRNKSCHTREHRGRATLWFQEYLLAPVLNNSCHTYFFWWVLQHCTGFARLVWGRLRVHLSFHLFKSVCVLNNSCHTYKRITHTNESLNDA